jgi:hypothetical protein
LVIAKARAPHSSIAVANTSTGRITRRLSPGKGEIESIAASPDGRTLYFSAGNKIWSISVAGGEPRLIRTGHYVVTDPSGATLVISLAESSKMRLFQVPLRGGPEREITTDGSFPLFDYPLSPGALNDNGGLLLSLADSWFNRPALLDISTGRLAALPFDGMSDYHAMAWLPNGQIMALHKGLRSRLWLFQPITPTHK